MSPETACVLLNPSLALISSRSVLPLALLLIGLLTANSLPTYAQTASLRGFVTDASDGQPLELVNLTLTDAQGTVIGVVTNEDGLYVLPRIRPGTYILNVSFIGYQTYTDSLTFSRGERRSLNIDLEPGSETLDEVLIEAERTTGAANITAGFQTVRPADIELIPAPDISADLASFITTLPGVVALGDRGGQLFIRGGEPAQNLVQLDGVLLYQPFHILGFYSAFPADILSRTDIYAGGFGSKFGERISSVIDIKTRNGNNQAFAGAITLSPFVSAARIEGPLVRNKVSLLASVRQSVVEQGAANLVDEDLPFNFGDVYVKLNADVRTTTKLSLFMIRTHDRGTVGPESEGLSAEEVGWRNFAASVRLLALPDVSSAMFDLRVSYSRLPSWFGPKDDPIRTSTIDNLHFAAEATFFSPQSDVDTGVSVRFISMESELGGLYQNIETRNQSIEHAGVYIEPEFNTDSGLSIRPGIRAQFYDVRFGPFLEPRLRVVWTRGMHKISGATGVYNQAVLGLNDRRDAANVFTVWSSIPKETTQTTDVRAGKATQALHALLGYQVAFPWGLELSVEGFAKRLNDLFIAEWTAFPRFTTRLQPADGRSFGYDLRVEVRRPRFYGYVTYGYSNTRYDAQQAALQIWYGTESLRFSPPHDRRHQLNALASTNIAGFDVSARWELGSGLPFSQAVAFDGFALINDIIDAGEAPFSRRVIYERPFNARLPTYHRLDLSVNRTFDLGMSALTVQGSLINVYNRRNLFYLDVFTLRRVDQLPLIPSFGLKLEV